VDIRDPLFIHLVMAALSVWPLIRIARRVGRPSWPAWLVFLPMLGPPIAVTLLIRGPWPNYPDDAPVPHPRAAKGG
jgi:hypothetical protein